MNPSKMTNYFLHYHSHEIKRQTTFGCRTLNIDAHPYLGGLGFPVPKGVIPRFSEHQRALASHLLQAAKQEFFGLPSDHPLKPFAFLDMSAAATRSLGQKPGHVFTRLGSPTGPYLIDETPFADNSSIHATPLAMAYGDLDESVLTPSCRLSNSELGRLLKSANHQRMPMVDVEDMTMFPFKVVSFDPLTSSNHEIYESAFDDVLANQDEMDSTPTISTSPAPESSDSSDDEDEEDTGPEIWELPHYPFTSQLKSLVDPQQFLSPLHVSLRIEAEKQRRLERRMAVRERIAAARHMDVQLGRRPPTRNQPRLRPLDCFGPC
jgi:hypothetical protein